MLATYNEMGREKKTIKPNQKCQQLRCEPPNLPTPMPALGVSDGLMRRGDLNMRNFQELSKNSRFLSTRRFESERELCPNKPRFSAHSLQQGVN